MSQSEKIAEMLKADSNDEYFFEEGCFILELSNRADDPAVSIARARLKPGKTTRLHKLAAVIERYVIISGQGQVRLGAGTANVIESEVSPYDVVIIPAGVAQQIQNIGNDDLVFLAICSPRFTPECYVDIDPEPREVAP